jgi:hypothetical protein
VVELQFKKIMMKKIKKTTDKTNTGDAKGKASFDQNGKGNSPKYGDAGHETNESGKGMDKIKQDKK